MKKFVSIGQLMTDYRSRNNISQGDLAAAFNVDIRTIIRWEKNETLLKSNKEEEMVDITFIPYQVIRNLNAPVSIPTYYDFDIRKYSLNSVSIDIPDATWMRSKINTTTDRLRTISHESDIEVIIRCTMVQKHIPKPMRSDIILKATKLLPELNTILFDSSGYYAGHTVVFPISKHCYTNIKNGTLKEKDISPEDIIDHKTETDCVFYAYDLNADCNENLYYIAAVILHFFKDLNPEYLYATYTSREDGLDINKQIGLHIIREDTDLQKKINSKVPPTLFEGNFKKFLSV